jgi:class 3 adenylate cyclase
MGINSGIVSLGMTRFEGAVGTRMTFTAAGPVTNLAARIAAAATNGDILIGPETANRIKDETTLYGRGMLAFKNVQGEVSVFSLVHAQ